MKVQRNLKTNNINLKKRARQGDPIQPKLFTLVFEKFNQQMRSIKVDSSFFNHLRLAGDIVLLSSDIYELLHMMNELNHASKQVALKMNIQKTKIESRDNIAIMIDQKQIEKCFFYIFRIIARQTQDKDIREKTKVRNVMKEIAVKMLSWAGHIARQYSSRWNLGTLQWTLLDIKINRANHKEDRCMIFERQTNMEEYGDGFHSGVYGDYPKKKIFH